MYRPSAFDLTSLSEILEAVRRSGFGHLVTNGPSGLDSTALPFVVDDQLNELRAHVARANTHWREIDGASALMIVSGVDAYVSPRWYRSTTEHGEVVPTELRTGAPARHRFRSRRPRVDATTRE